jgi:hypothetical protein
VKTTKLRTSGRTLEKPPKLIDDNMARCAVRAIGARRWFCHASCRAAGSACRGFLGLPLNGTTGQIAMDCVSCGSGAVTERPELTAQSAPSFRPAAILGNLTTHHQQRLREA